MKRKIAVLLVVLGLCFLPQMAASTPPLCSWICCPAMDWGAECSPYVPSYYTTTCQMWWYYEGGMCP